MISPLELNRIFATNVRKILSECKITEKALAESVGMSVPVFYGKLNSAKNNDVHHKFNIAEIQAICKELDESIDDMLEVKE